MRFFDWIQIIFLRLIALILSKHDIEDLTSSSNSAGSNVFDGSSTITPTTMNPVQFFGEDSVSTTTTTSTALKPEDLYIDLNDVPNPTWEELKETLTVGENSYGPAYGSTIIPVLEQTTTSKSLRNKQQTGTVMTDIALHTVTSSSVRRPYFADVTRWYQEVDSTQIFRMFPDEDNVRNERENAPRIEAFGLLGWKRGDGWHEFSARYTFVKVREGAVFQIKHNSTYWSMQLILEANPDNCTKWDLYYVKLRDPYAKTLLASDVVTNSYDVRILDNGEQHKVYFDGELRVDDIMTDRPIDDDNRARWGMYSPKRPMDTDILIFVTDAYVGKVNDDDGSSLYSFASKVLSSILHAFRPSR